MSDKPEPSKRSAVSKPAQRSERDRLAAALKDNLRRRKAQARARREPGLGRQDG